jgi:hypothetical protein
MNDREIKFRYVFKHLVTGDLKSEVFTLDQIQNEVKHLIAVAYDSGYRLIARDEFTGRVDKCGKEIYRGDILQADDPRDKLTFSVKWYDNGGFNLLGINTAAFLVIGNVYDNPVIQKEATSC